MIYDCPSCGAPQEAGVTACPRCHAQFDGPVPDDASMPPAETEAQGEAVSALEAELTPSEEETPIADTETIPAAAPLEEVRPPLATDALPPFVPTPSPSMPYISPVPPAPTPFLGGLTKALLIAFPIVLVLVLGGVYFANSLNTDTETNSDNTFASAPAVSTQFPVSPPPAPTQSPVTMQGGTNTTSAKEDPHSKMLVGRWESKSQDFYVFNDNGTGSRGNSAKQQKEESFLWALAQNRLMLYMDKNITLRMNSGPDDNTVFLGSPTGHYMLFRRTKT